MKLLSPIFLDVRVVCSSVRVLFDQLGHQKNRKNLTAILMEKKLQCHMKFDHGKSQHASILGYNTRKQRIMAEDKAWDGKEYVELLVNHVANMDPSAPNDSWPRGEQENYDHIVS